MNDGPAIDSDDYGLGRTVVAVRTAVVLSVGLLLLVGPPWVRLHITATLVVLSAALLYSVVLLVNPGPEVRRTRYAWGVSLIDGGFTLALIALTGGVNSPVTTVLALAVIASAARMSFRETLGFAALLGAGYAAVALHSPTPAVITPDP